MQRNYPVVIHKDPDSNYYVIVPDLPGCITAGNTLDDAQNQALEAIQCHTVFLMPVSKRSKMHSLRPYAIAQQKEHPRVHHVQYISNDALTQDVD